MIKDSKYDPDGSGYGNEVLYRMCKEEPFHNDLAVVEGKIWLIGRSYSASIERQAGSGFKLRKALETIYKDNPEYFKIIDEHIYKISCIENTTTENLNHILFAHKCLVDFFFQLIRVEGKSQGAIIVNKRSLASKYLHFHAPKSVFIFDSVVDGNIRKELRKLGLKRNYFDIVDQSSTDSIYEGFVRRCIYYRNNVLIKKDMSPRALDMHLYRD